MYSDSLKELKVTKNMVVCALMAALAIVLRSVASIDIGPYVRIGFADIPNRIVEFLFGPVTGCFFDGALDILKFVTKPTGTFFPGFTFDAMLSGLLYGSLLYKRPVSLKRIVLADFLNKLIVNCGLHTLWIAMLYGQGFLVLLPARLLKNIVMLPIDSAILYFSFTMLGKMKKNLF